VTPQPLRAKIIADRTHWVRRMLAQLGALPVETFDAFRSDSRNLAAAESYLRRALEALLDLGRHVLSKGFARPVTEYSEIAPALVAAGLLNEQQGRLLRQMAGYRNRMVHFYHEISERELYDIVATQLEDVDQVLDAILDWLRNHPEMLDQAL